MVRCELSEAILLCQGGDDDDGLLGTIGRRDGATRRQVGDLSGCIPKTGAVDRIESRVHCELLVRTTGEIPNGRSDQ